MRNSSSRPKTLREIVLLQTLCVYLYLKLSFVSAAAV